MSFVSVRELLQGDSLSIIHLFKINYYLLLLSRFSIIRAFERTTPIFFDAIQNGEAGEDFFHAHNAAFQHASTNCLPSIIRMGEYIFMIFLYAKN